MKDLQRHPASIGADDFTIAGWIEPGPSGFLRVSFRLRGPTQRLNWPHAGGRNRADGLWRTTCFEAFLRAEDGPAYWEWNFSPSGKWAAYRFEDYRIPAPGLADAPDPQIVCEIETHQAFLVAQIPCPSFDAPERNKNGHGLKVCLSAVLESTQGQLSYWALAHGADRPDFHHAAGFVLPL